MADKSIEKEVLDLENRYWTAIKNKDIGTAEELTDDPCLVAGSKGVARVAKKDFRGIMESSKYTLHDFKISDTQVQFLNENVAALVYKVHEELTVEGEPISLDAFESSTWVKRGGRWMCALHTETLQGDPYGRDRNEKKVA